MITFDRVSKRYEEGHDALREISVTIERDELVFLTGHSGAGKSTLLRLIMLMDRPSRGQVTVDGQNLANVRPRGIPQHRRNIGVVFQNHQLLFDRTVFDIEDELGAATTQTHFFPSRNACLQCHEAPGTVLGLQTAMINRNLDYGATVDNQLRALRAAGVFEGTPHFSTLELASLAVGQAVTEACLTRAARESAAESPAEVACPSCGQVCRVEHRARELHGVAGPVEVLEPVAHCPACRRDFFPSA